MRLLNTATLKLTEFQDGSAPPYSIASHRWTSDETTFKDMKKGRNTDSLGYQKVLAFCNYLKNSIGHPGEIHSQWLWIDTACIDKSSSAEISESINSMFEWYSNAEICYAFLQDVTQLDDTFDNSDWFRRGWTLQEMLAPLTVVFLSQSWQVLGHKCSFLDSAQECLERHHVYGLCLNSSLAHITGIPVAALQGFGSVRDRYSLNDIKQWSLNRTTTRIEDGAYCLLGLLGVHMVPIYGERESAHARLLDEVIRKQDRKLAHDSYMGPVELSLMQDRLRQQSQEIEVEVEKARRQSATIGGMFVRLKQQNDQIQQQSEALRVLHDRHETSINAVLNFLATFYKKLLPDQDSQNGPVLQNTSEQSVLQSHEQLELEQQQSFGQLDMHATPDDPYSASHVVESAQTTDQPQKKRPRKPSDDADRDKAITKSIKRPQLLLEAPPIPKGRSDMASMADSGTPS